MFKRILTPLVAGAVAITLYAMPAQAGPAQDRQYGVSRAEQTWQQDGVKSGKAWRENRQLRKSKRRGERGLYRKENRRTRWQEARVNRKARRNARAGRVATTHQGGDHPGSINQILNGYDLPEYYGGFNQPRSNGTGSINRALNGYDIPEYFNGHNQPLDNGSGSILEAIGNAGIYD